MARIEINLENIFANVAWMNTFMRKWKREWTLVIKVLGAQKVILEKLLMHPEVQKIHSIGDSHLSGLKLVKKINPELRTMYIKPPALRYIPNVVRYADISLNSTISTIEALDREARKQEKIHQIIVMIEMGELREGIVREEFLKFYEKIFRLENIQVIGLGTNLGCMYGVEPTYDKLIQLCLYEQIIEARFKRKLELVSGGSSITLPILDTGKIPAGTNHFRIGEAIFLGTSPLDGNRFKKLSDETFILNANILELYKKDSIPDGTLTEGSIGETSDLATEGESYKGIVDFGVLDVDANNLTPLNAEARFFGNTSDMTVYDLGLNKKKLKSGDSMKFIPNYMAVAKLMNSRFIDKVIV